jgi:hypothetical protein
MTKPLKKRSRQIEPTAETDSLSDDLVSLLLDRQMDIAADYVRRGRSHRELNAAELGSFLQFQWLARRDRDHDPPAARRFCGPFLIHESDLAIVNLAHCPQAVLGYAGHNLGHWTEPFDPRGTQ